MRSWNLHEIDTPGGRTSPVVLFSEDSRAVLLGLDPGQELGEHEVRERAWVLVVHGEIEVEADAELTTVRAGSLVTFAPGERHSVNSPTGARLLLLLAPWPGAGHYPA